jgi:RNA polymerase sigma-70 factor, ECF subfamily
MDESRISVNELAQVCAHSDDASVWEELLRRTTPLAALVAVRVARLWMSPSSPAQVDDIVQETYLRLCEHKRRILSEFEPRGEDSFLGLLRRVATSAANDHFRRLRSAKRGGKAVMSELDVETAFRNAAGDGEPADAQRQVLYEQLDCRMRAAPDVIGERDRRLFWLYYLQGLTAEEIAALPAIGLTAKGVESVLRRVSLWLRGQVTKTSLPQNGLANGRVTAPAPEGKMAANPLDRG